MGDLSASDPAVQNFYRHHTQFFLEGVHGGQRRIKHLTHGNIVKPDDGNIIGHPIAVLLQDPDHSGGQNIVFREQCVRQIRKLFDPGVKVLKCAFGGDIHLDRGGQRETGETDEDGKLTVPAVTETEYHGAYIVGYTDGTFGPERSMSRSEAAAIFARLLSDKLDERIPSGNNVKFKDIDPDMWYAGYVEYLTGYGVAVGYNDRTYRGDKAITRAEFTAMAARFFDVYGDGAEEIMEQYEDFDDVSDGYWAAEYIKDAAIHGWVEGYGDGTFRADDPIDRAEVVTIVNRLLGREADEDYIADNHRRLVMFPDVSSRHWAYYNVLEAANAHTAILTAPETWDK